MARRQVDAPDSALVGAREAARWLGVSEAMFRQLAAAEDWMRPIVLGGGDRKAHKWPWEDVVCLRHILARRRQGGSEKPEKS